MDENLKRRNRRLSILLLAALAVMFVFPWAYGPAFHKVCGVLGIQTTSSRPVDALLTTAEHGIGADRKDKAHYSLVNFMGVSGEVPIDIHPLKPHAWVKIGELTAVTYRLTNLTDHQVDFKAMHMLEPASDSGSFELIKCFCDVHRVLKAHETEDYPLVFRIVKPIPGDDGLTINYTIFNFDRNATAQPAAISER